MENRFLGIFFVVVSFFSVLEWHRYDADYGKFNLTAFVVAIVCAAIGLYIIFIKKDDDDK